jgi:hypothetical protein
MRKRLALLALLLIIVLSSAGIVTIISAQEGPTSTPSAGTLPLTGATRPAQHAEARVQGLSVTNEQPHSIPPLELPTPSQRPLEVEFYPDRIYQGNFTTLYRLSRETGILASTDGGKSWVDKTVGLPFRSVYPFDRARPPIITSLAVDPMNDSRVAITLPDMVFLSEDGGGTWVQINVKDPLKPNDQLTAVALNPSNAKALLIGTSFHGFFETLDKGKTWSDLSQKLAFMYFGSGSFEEISSIAYNPADPSLIYFSLGFGKGLYWMKKGANTATRIDFPGDKAHAPIVDLRFTRSADAGLPPAGSNLTSLVAGSAVPAWNLEVRTDDARWVLASDNSSPVGTAGAPGSGGLPPSPGPSGAQSAPGGVAPPAGSKLAPLAAGTALPAWTLTDLIRVEAPMDPAKAERISKASGKFGIYVSSVQANGKLLDNHIAFCKANGLNAITVDCKDDFGFVTYDTGLEKPRRIGAVKERFKTADLTREAHTNGLYVIARIVEYQDKQLYNADGYANATWDRVTKGPWRPLKTSVDPQTGAESTYQGEFWVDPYSEAVWKYNIDIARELEQRGFDEIQFDYIRFPSDGNLSRIIYRYQKEGMGKLEALESFLTMARENLDVPISTDVYGFCGWARVSGWVGQNIELFSAYVDVICPMLYPSHFPRDFLGQMDYLSRANFIYREGGDRASRIVRGNSVIRPYVQAFRLGGELQFSKAVYSSYLINEIQGTLQGSSSGFTLWNASNDYYMVTVPLTSYLTGPAAAGGPSPQGG